MKTLHTYRGSVGLPASPNKVEPLVNASGVPFEDGLAHNTLEAIPDENLFRSGVLTTLAG
jgi:hypothetical protein